MSGSLNKKETVIKEHDLVQSIAAAVQWISYYHPEDFIQHLVHAYEKEENPAAKDALAQILANSKMSALGKRPMCQDTGMVNISLQVGMQVRFDTQRSLQELCDEGVRLGYMNRQNPLRASMVADPIFKRKNTEDNTPCMLSVELVPGHCLDVHISAKGGGSENKAQFKVLTPAQSITEWVLEKVRNMGAGWCPPGVLGIGVGGSADQCMRLAKQALNEELDMLQLVRHGPTNALEALRIDLYKKINALGIGAQGLGGLTTVLDVKIKTMPTHAASKPVALIPNCTANRQIKFQLNGQGVAEIAAPNLSLWPRIQWEPDLASARAVDLNCLTAQQVAQWQLGETLLLSGRLLTGRDAAHQRIQQLLVQGKPLPVCFKNRVIYYVGPVAAKHGEVVGPAGPTTATRMDQFTEMMLGQSGLLAMIGKAERGTQALAAIKKHKAVYLAAVGGAAYLISKSIKSARVVAFADLGMEAIYEFEVENLPVTVAVDSQGYSIHEIGPSHWQKKMENIPILPQ